MLPYWYYFKFSGGKSIYRAISIDTSLIIIKSTSDLTVKNKPRNKPSVWMIKHLSTRLIQFGAKPVLNLDVQDVAFLGVMSADPR